MSTVSGGEVLRRYREQAKMTQEELAVEVGKTEAAAWQWENGRAVPRRTTALQLDRLLGAGGEILNAFGYAPELDPDNGGGLIKLGQDTPVLLAKFSALAQAAARMEVAIGESERWRTHTEEQLAEIERRLAQLERQEPRTD